MSKYSRNHKRRLNKVTGFTLMELLIALFVFALLSGFAFQAVKQLTKSSGILNEEQMALGGLNRFWLMLEQDVLSEGIPSPVAYAFDEQNDNHFVLGGAIYRLEEGTLYRKAVLPGDGRMGESALLTGIESFEVVCQRDDGVNCDISADRKELSMINVLIKGRNDIDAKRVFHVAAGASEVQKILTAMGGLSMEQLAGALQETSLVPLTPEEQAVVDVVTGL